MTQQQHYRCIPCGLDMTEAEAAAHHCPRLRDEVAVNEAARVETVAEILRDGETVWRPGWDNSRYPYWNEATTTNGQDREAGDDD